MTIQTKPEETQELLGKLPPLPAVVRYYDDFSDSYGQVVDMDRSDQWRIRFDGGNTTLDFGKFDVRIRSAVKSWCASLLATLSPRSIEYYFYAIQRAQLNQVIGILTSKPARDSHYLEIAAIDKPSIRSICGT